MLKMDIEKKMGEFRLAVAFESGEGITGILGPSGCGKSMTLGCIAGIVRPDRGRIELDGVTLFDSDRGINLPPQKRRVGYLFQSYALFPNMTVERNILCGLSHERDRGKKAEALAAIIAMLRLEGLEKRRPSQLSGGQAQRVALARILVGNPRLLMLDEPFSALDSHLRDQLQIEVKSLLTQYGGNVLMVTHSRDEAYHLCQDIALMENGMIHALKPTKELFADPGTVAGARMTGIKNIAPARKAGDFLVEVPQWGVTLTTARPVEEHVCAVAVRAHYFSPGSRQNVFTIEKTDEMEEPFEWIVRFRYQNQLPESPDIWWRLPKDRRPQDMPATIGVSPHNVLPLYPEREGHKN